MLFVSLLLHSLTIFFASFLFSALQYCSLLKLGIFAVVVVAIVITIAADVLFQDVKCAFWFSFVLFGCCVTSSSAVVNMRGFLFLSFFSSGEVFEPANGIEVFLNCF